LSHYWGNKQALFKEVCVRRFVAIRDDLDAGRKVDIRTLLRALVEPSLNMEGMSEKDRATYRALYGRAYTEPSPEVLTTMREIYDEDGHLMLSLLRRLCPDLTARDFFWRANSVIGALVISLTYGDRLADFLAGGMLAR
jgi:AcrR family transcriptional regulator